MKETMRDKVCQLIGKYQAEEAFHRERAGDVKPSSRLNTDSVEAECYQAILKDLEALLDGE